MVCVSWIMASPFDRCSVLYLRTMSRHALGVVGSWTPSGVCNDSFSLGIESDPKDVLLLSSRGLVPPASGRESEGVE